MTMQSFFKKIDIFVMQFICKWCFQIIKWFQRPHLYREKVVLGFYLDDNITYTQQVVQMTRT